MGDRGGVVMFSLAYFPDTLLPYQANRITPLLSNEGGGERGVEGRIVCLNFLLSVNGPSSLPCVIYICYSWWLTCKVQHTVICYVI